VRSNKEIIYPSVTTIALSPDADDRFTPRQYVKKSPGDNKSMRPKGEAPGKEQMISVRRKGEIPAEAKAKSISLSNFLPSLEHADIGPLGRAFSEDCQYYPVIESLVESSGLTLKVEEDGFTGDEIVKVSAEEKTITVRRAAAFCRPPGYARTN